MTTTGQDQILQETETQNITRFNLVSEQLKELSQQKRASKMLSYLTDTMHDQAAQWLLAGIICKDEYVFYINKFRLVGECQREDMN